MPKQHRENLPAFVAECTLGRLAKWLRLAGFDTLFDNQSPDINRLSNCAKTQNRVVLSRTQAVIKHLEIAQGRLIRFNAPIDQIRQVIRDFDIDRPDLRPLSRCSQCNHPLRAADQENIQGAVPDYILLYHERFRICPRCRRVYWPGSHSTRILALIDRWFELS